MKAFFEFMKAFFEFMKALLKIKDIRKFYGMLIFLGFLAYLLFGGGLGHLGMLKDFIGGNPKAEVVSE